MLQFLLSPIALHAQTILNFNPPDIKVVDQIGVNVLSGLPQATLNPVSIGPAGSGLGLPLRFDGIAGANELSDGNYGLIYQSKIGIGCTGAPSCPEYIVSVRNTSERFYLNGGTFYSIAQNGSALISNADGTYTYTTRDGTRFKANPNIRSAICSYSPCARIIEIDRPDGLSTYINYATTTTSDTGYSLSRIRSVSQNNGYQLRYSYALNSQPSSSTYTQWMTIVGATATNDAKDYCDPAIDTCSYSISWPTASFSWAGIASPGSGAATLSVLDMGGQLHQFTNQTDVNYVTRMMSFKGPSSPSASTATYSYSNYNVCTDGGGFWLCSAIRPELTSSATIGSGAWSYGYSHPNVGDITGNSGAGVYGYWTASSTGPQGYVLSVLHNSITGYIYSISTSDSYGAYSNDDTNRLMSARDSQGRNFSFLYDARGNTTEKRQIAGSGLTDVVLTQGFDSVCSNPVTCNKPNWVRDANLNQTDYTYDPVHGGILSETSAAPVAGGVRPQKRYAYAQRYAWVKNSAGSYVRSASPIWVLNQISSCIKGAWSSAAGACVNTSGVAIVNDQVITSYDYGPDSGPNNLLVRGQVVTADGQSLRTCYAYDVYGNRISETTPNASLGSCP